MQRVGLHPLPESFPGVLASWQRKTAASAVAAAMSRREDAQALLPPFTPSLRYFAAVFDSLHECLPAHSAERLAIERNHLGMEISDAMASFFSCVDADGVDDVTSERDGMLF